MKLKMVLVFLLGGLAVYAQQPNGLPQDSRFKSLEPQFEKLLKASKASGFSVAVVEKGKIIYSKGFGFSNFEEKTPASASTLYAIGSCTKAFTAALMGILQKEGKIDWDTPVRNYLPELKFFNEAMNNSISIRDMLCHRTGLPRHDYSWYLFPTTRDSLLQRIQYLQPNVAPRLKYQYNNFMFMAIGKVAEKLYNNSWEKIVQEKLFSPLGMLHTNFTNKPFLNDNKLAVPYALQEDSTLKKLEHYPIEGMGPAGSIYSSVNDMALWVQCWLQNGTVNGKEIIPSGYIKEAISAQMIANAMPPDIKHPDLQFGAYGFAWALSAFKGHYRVEHGGNIDGFSASTTFFPTDSLGIVVLTNQNGSWLPNAVGNVIADKLLKTKPNNWLEEIVTEIAKSKQITDSVQPKVVDTRRKTAPSHPANDYDGFFGHPGYGTLHVFHVGDSLMARSALYNWWLEHYQYDVFVPYIITNNDLPDTSKRPSIRLQFQSGVNGEIVAAELFGLEDPSIPIIFNRLPNPEPVTKGTFLDFTGNYALSGLNVQVFIKNELLYIVVPGQPDYALQYLGKDRFNFRDLKGYILQFSRNSKNQVTAATFIQPNGTFVAQKKR